MRPFLWSLGALLIGLSLFEISMRPSRGDRIELTLIFLMMALAMWAAARWLPQVARRYRSIRITLAVLALAAFAIVVAGVVAVGNRMFASTHDLTLLLVVVAFGLVAAVGFALSVSRPLTEDLNMLSIGAGLVARGRLQPVVVLNRRDEVGRLSSALNDMIAQLEQAEIQRQADTRSRREFFASVSHDLRTPLASMRAAVEAIKDGIAADPMRYLDSIEHDISALTNLVDDVYLLARLDSGAEDLPLAPVDLAEVVDETVEMLQPLAVRHQVIIRTSPGERLLALGSQKAVSRVLRNLVDNAIRHSPSGCTVDIATDRVDGRVRVVVTDEGPGFESEFISLAFDRFTRSEVSRARDGGGSGLGLAIARSLMEAMGGRIWIVAGNGGRVAFELPTDMPPQPQGREVRYRSAAPHHRA